MNLQQIKSKIQNGGFDTDFALLYDDVLLARERYLEACDEFLALYGERDNIRLFSAPGRTEVGGNHTDHQHGRVLTGSVNLDVIAVVSATDNNTVRIKSKGFDMDTVDITDLDIKESEEGKAIALIRGMLSFFKQSGANIGGFDAYTTSNVLKGSGLSSSAAFEVLIGNIINGLYNDSAVSAVEIAKMSQKSESRYFGKPCGMLDQMASSVGGFTGMDFKDPQNPVIEKVQLDLDAYKHKLCIVNTGGNHANLTGDYADITIECRKISNALGKDFLRDVDEDEFYKAIPALRDDCGDRAILRAIHFFGDNNKAYEEKEALKAGDFEGFLKLINASGDSSFMYLQNVYSNSDVSEQGVSLALALTKQFLNGKGACRVHGGGFAGTIQAFVPDDMVESYKTYIEAFFGEGSCYILKIRSVGGYELK